MERYRNPNLGIDDRVGDLLSRMTLQEKAAQLGCAWVTALMGPDGFSRERASKVAPDGLGEVTRISGSTALVPKESAAVMNEIQHYMVEETRLGIPVIVHEEGTGGFSARGATVFPQAIGLAASFDPDLVEEVAAVVREQMRAVGARHCLAPVLDVARDPRWGRVEETLGEDPVLVGTLGTAYVRGLQGGDLARGVLATGKHFIGHAASVGGRNHAPVHLGPRELREVHAEPFAMAIAHAGLGSVMNAYNSVDGLACAASRSILTDLLRGELAFSGMVVADYYALLQLAAYHHLAADKREAAVRALSAGLDLELPETDCYGAPLDAALKDGQLPVETVDAAVRRVLAAKFALGLFEHPFVEEDLASLVFDTPGQRALARRAAASAIVLLSNDGVLPLSQAMRRIAVIGAGADDRRLLQGDYHYPGHQEIAYRDGTEASLGWSEDIAPSLPAGGGEWRPSRYYVDHVTPLAGIRALAGDGCEVLHAPGCTVSGSDRSGIADAARLGSTCDVAVVVVAGRSGLSQACTVGEARDAACLELTGVQGELVRAVAGSGVPTVVVAMSGRVHALEDVVSSCRALLYAGPLGEEGGAALAEVLFGVVNPAGRLPVTLPRSVGQLPLHVGQRAGGSTSMFYGDYTDSPMSPLFAFGHGLSYTSFGYKGLLVEASDTRHPLRVAVEVTNLGGCPGDEVVQLYAVDLVASVARPERQLVGFVRTALVAGEHRYVVFEVHPSRLAFFDEGMRRVTEPGEFRFEVGASSTDIRAATTVRLGGEVVEYPITSVRPTTARVV
ncbi:MAG TPA: glycoside hydrolase family 3 N-terminal domain-containing protein [Acidimicrobiales bacterium]|nr:glycoside hydrolase family 3 N-terminal domain-containing protein [Acidimicrobiales bacterium]